jgi:hypothetical protein
MNSLVLASSSRKCLDVLTEFLRAGAWEKQPRLATLFAYKRCEGNALFHLKPKFVETI